MACQTIKAPKGNHLFGFIKAKQLTIFVKIKQVKTSKNFYSTGTTLN